MFFHFIEKNKSERPAIKEVLNYKLEREIYLRKGLNIQPLASIISKDKKVIAVSVKDKYGTLLCHFSLVEIYSEDKLKSRKIDLFRSYSDFIESFEDLFLESYSDEEKVLEAFKNLLKRLEKS